MHADKDAFIAEFPEWNERNEDALMTRKEKEERKGATVDNPIDADADVPVDPEDRVYLDDNEDQAPKEEEEEIELSTGPASKGKKKVYVAVPPHPQEAERRVAARAGTDFGA